MRRFSGPSDQSEEPTRGQSSAPTTDQIIREPGSPESSTTSTQSNIPTAGNIQHRSWAESSGPTPLLETNELRDLFCNFSATKSQFATIKPPPPAPAAEDPEEVLEHVQAYSMSRHQYALAEVEEQIWNRLLYAPEPFPDEPEDAGVDVQGRLSQLELKSNSMADMYERRRPPDQEIYNDCKLIIRAMGIPCLESPIAIEGEAYAAALVRNGRGDYVASEDTVGDAISV
jgi:flap endonuclease-1